MLYKNVYLWKKNLIIIIKKIINEGEIEEDNKSPNTSGFHITVGGLLNGKDTSFIIIFNLIYILILHRVCNFIFNIKW